MSIIQLFIQKNNNEYLHVDMNLADTYDTQNCKHMVT